MVDWGTGVGPVTSRGKEKGKVVTPLELIDDVVGWWGVSFISSIQIFD